MHDFSDRRSIKKVRKGRTCEHCGTAICPGEPAMREVGRWDGEFYVLYAHPDCRGMWIELYKRTDVALDEGMDPRLLDVLGEDADDDTILATLQTWEDDYPFVVARIKSVMKKAAW